jgi:hypothetical protein
MISQLSTDVNETNDNLLQAKIFQTHHTNEHRTPEVMYQEGDKVMLLTLHH